MTSRFDRVSRDPGFRELFKIARRRDWPKNRVVIEEGGKPGKLYLIMSGLATVRHGGTRGAELLLAYLYPGDFLGEMCLFPGVDARSAMIRTATDCAMLEIDYEPFVELTRTYPSLWLELAGQLATRLRITNHRLATMPTLHAADRLWLVIAEMASAMGSNGDARDAAEGRTIRVTRQDLGKLAGCSRELAGMILKDFARAGRIVLRGNSIVVPMASLQPESESPGAVEAPGH